MSNPIETITIDEVQYAVADMPEHIQLAVRKYEEWRERLTLARDEVQLVECALRDLGANIVKAVQEVNESVEPEADPVADPHPMQIPDNQDVLVVE